jgi:hypothetical protein
LVRSPALRSLRNYRNLPLPLPARPCPLKKEKNAKTKRYLLEPPRPLAPARPLAPCDLAPARVPPSSRRRCLPSPPPALLFPRRSSSLHLPRLPFPTAGSSLPPPAPVACIWPCPEVALPRRTDDDAAAHASANGKIISIRVQLSLFAHHGFLTRSDSWVLLYQIIFCCD